MRLNAHIPPDSPAATAAHRAVMAAGAMRLAGSDQRGARALAAALRDIAAGRMPDAEREWADRVERRRAEIPFAMVEEAVGWGADDPAPDDSPSQRAGRLAAAWETCRWTSLPPLWGRFLTRLVRELRPRACLELGSGLGLSALYQGAALELNGRGELATMDFHPAARIAERGLVGLGLDGRVRFEFGDIDERLGPLLARLGPVDYALLDADHSEEATVRHFEAVLPHLAGSAVVLLDDITQTAEMRSAWNRVAAHDRVAVAVGLRRMGALVLTEHGPR